MEHLEHMTEKPHQFVVFALDGQQYALDCIVVERVIRIVEITTAPDAPESMLGVINMQGQVIPVLDLRRLLRIPEKAPDLCDQLIIARASHFCIALPVDVVTGVIECHERNITVSDEIFPGIVSVKGVAKRNGSIIFIYDIDRFLALEGHEREDKMRTGKALDQGAGVQ